MAKLLALICFAFFLTIVIGSPVKQHKKRSFKVKRVEVPNYKPNGPKAYKRALLKFGFDDISFLPDGEVANRIKAATAASISGAGEEDGETAAAPTQNDAQFLSPVSVGGQTLIMNFDSGSSDTYVHINGWLEYVALTFMQMGFQYRSPCRISTWTHHLRPNSVKQLPATGRLHLQHHLRRWLLRFWTSRYRHSRHWWLDC